MRRAWLVLLLAGALLAASPVPRAWASAAAAPEGGQAGEKGPAGGKDLEHEESGLFGRVALDLAVWTIVVFLVLLFILGKFAWPQLIQGLDQRERAIHSAVEDAQRARDEAQQLRQQLEQEMNKAQERVRDLLTEAERNAQQVREQMVGEARKEIQAERDRLHREVEMARDQALQQIWGQAADLAALISTRAIRRQLTPDDHRNLVDEALVDLREAGNNRERKVASV